MKISDMEYIVNFAAKSSATLIVASCITGCVYGPPPNHDPWDSGQTPEMIQEVEIQNEK